MSMSEKTHVVDYTVIEAFSPLTLATAVRFGIEEGWEPIGGVAIGPGDYCAQAMVKRVPIGFGQ
jgi:hypothetical protein